MSRDLFDISLQYCGNLESACLLSAINDIGITDIVTNIIEVVTKDNVVTSEYRARRIKPATYINEEHPATSVDERNVVKIIRKQHVERYNRCLDRQTIFDYALQHYGDAAAAFKLSSQTDTSVTEPQPSSIFKYRLNVNKRVLKHYTDYGIKPATDLCLDDELSSMTLAAYYTIVKYIIPEYSETKYYTIP